jgi:hypothetical protein
MAALSRERKKRMDMLRQLFLSGDCLVGWDGGYMCPGHLTSGTGLDKKKLKTMKNTILYMMY